MILTAAILLGGLPVQERELSAAEYRGRLASISAALDRKDLPAARSQAEDLRKARVRDGETTAAADETVLGPLAAARSLEETRAPARRLRALVQALEAVPAAPPARDPDHQRLERLRREEAESELSQAGKVGGPELHPPEVPKSFIERLSELGRDIGDFVMKVLKWILRLFIRTGGGAAQSGTPLLVIGLVILIVGTLAAVAVVVIRKRRGLASAAEAVSSGRASSERDDDPLSRTASEWERHAAELTKAGRYREAIRAWYHAVLVSLFRAGLLHYRKDRTNWEYAYALPPHLGWRPGFLDATRTFEQEWYGRRDTPAETGESYALAARTLLSTVREGKAR